MQWDLYEIVFRLTSFLHVGSRRVGNILQTRSYLTGRNLWGALTERITRDLANGRGPADLPLAYNVVGDSVQRDLAFTYFYPARQTGAHRYEIAWPWQATAVAPLLGAYASTALDYPQRVADPTTLHEVEYMAPFWQDNGAPVYLVGYIFEKVRPAQLGWRQALTRLQVGGERTYGWGALALESIRQVQDGRLFDGRFETVPVAQPRQNSRPQLRAVTNADDTPRLLAHTRPEHIVAKGRIEPLVGREWRPERYRYIGQYVAYDGVCFTPGSETSGETTVAVGAMGVWEAVIS